MKKNHFIIKVLLFAIFLVCSNSTLFANSTKKDTLIFSPNESFFSPVGTLKANLKDKKSGNIYNKNEYYDYITNWKKISDTILFAIKIKEKGSLTIHPKITVSSEQNQSVVFVTIDQNTKELILKSNLENQNSITFKNINPGLHFIKFRLKKINTPSTSVGKFYNIKVTGTAAKNASVEMRRYRPFAVHCRWESEATKPIEISVHELTVINTKANVYQPITTPFGYTGSPWSLKKQTFGGYNFSLWSYGAKDPVPPFYQESHLIAVGKDLTFGSYGHEGTGVKPRGKNPYENLETNTQVIAVRKLPGKVYDTYWSYYFHPVEKEWKLYGAGKKFNKSGKETGLVTGAFVEVAGGAHVERSGHEVRESQYSGWQKDVDGNWFTINKMIGTSRNNTLSYRDWSIVNNKFSMKMGGFGELGIPKKTLVLKNPKEIPYYLKGEYIAQLYKMPAILTVDSTELKNANTVAINFTVKEAGENATAEIFYGENDGLTKENKWQNHKKLTIIEGNNSFIVSNLKTNTNYFYRIKVTNNKGITWLFNTHSFKTN